MGCTASRVANEDKVRRCKERRRLMKEAVISRHHLAAAHSDYLRSLRLTAAALSHFSSLHSLPVVNTHTPTPPPSEPELRRAETFSSKIEPSHHSTASNYAATTSHASSTWDWERFYPPSPPASDFFDHLERQRKQSTNEEDGSDDVGNSTVAKWVEHSRVSTSTSGSDQNEGEVESRSGYLGSFSEGGYRLGSSVASSSTAKMANLMGEGIEMVVASHRNLKEIAGAIEELFVRAATTGEAMVELLENGREQLDRSFRRLRKTVYHSSSVLSALSSTWTSKPPLAVKYQLDTSALDSGGGESHCSTLERLLAWEKKLYKEVKAREGVKIEHEKKLASLQCQEYKGEGEAKLDKTKASIHKLQSLIVVTSQAVSTTSSAIIKVRDDELAPQLVRICLGFLAMWRSMYECHKIQNSIVQQVRGLTANSEALESTSDIHRKATCDLESAVVDWHSSFTRLVKFNREYVRFLYGWVQLTRIDDTTITTTTTTTTTEEKIDKCDHPSPSFVSSQLLAFCDDWKQALDRIPDTVAAEAIHSFVNVIHSISLKQTEEFKIKKKVDHYSKELDKRTIALRNIEKKYYQSYSTVGIKLPDGGADDHVLDARDPLQQKKLEIEAIRGKVGDEMAKHSKAVKSTREMTLNNIQTALPGVFHAITAFSSVFVEALEGVCSHRGPQQIGGE